MIKLRPTNELYKDISEYTNLKRTNQSDFAELARIAIRVNEQHMKNLDAPPETFHIKHIKMNLYMTDFIREELERQGYRVEMIGGPSSFEEALNKEIQFHNYRIKW